MEASEKARFDQLYQHHLRALNLCLSVFPWAHFRTTKAAVKMHTLLDLRGQADLFFRWIKQHLQIKCFFGTSESAIKTQIWIAVSIYVLVAIVKKRLHFDASLYTLLQILSVSIFDKIPLQQAFSGSIYNSSENDSSTQLNLFGI